MANINYNPNLSLCGGPAPTPSPTPSPSGQAGVCPPTSPYPTVPPPAELHVCMGLNACKGHDRNGNNNCAGTGYCATATRHNCQTLNDCHGQGGCGLYGDAAQQMVPGANECAWQGSCAVPIQAERFSTLGDNTNKSVWLLARKLFEERMLKAKRTVGEAPFKCGPPQNWLVSVLGTYDSCGNSGNKSCSFGFNNPADNAKELCEGKEE